jgi:hypothetical protein
VSEVKGLTRLVGYLIGYDTIWLAPVKDFSVPVLEIQEKRRSEPALIINGNYPPTYQPLASLVKR